MPEGLTKPGSSSCLTRVLWRSPVGETSFEGGNDRSAGIIPASCPAPTREQSGDVRPPVHA
ncbi:MAG: hypothetical protein D6788_11245, partial [Planctomycetota bacterium]